MEFVESADGVRVAYEMIAGGQDAADDPVLVLPGGPCRGPEYLGDLGGLAAARSLAVLQPRGTSATGGSSRGWWADAADAAAAIEWLGPDAVDVVAHSAGARLALALTAQYPERVRSLALITPAAAWLTGAPHDGGLVAARRREPEIAAAVASMEREPADEKDFQRSWAIEAPAGYARWTSAEQEHARVGAVSLAAMESWFRDVPDDAAARVLAARVPPALVIGGAEDILSGVEPVRAFAAALGAELTLLPECGHYPWIEQPEPFLRVLDPWLTER